MVEYKINETSVCSYFKEVKDLTKTETCATIGEVVCKQILGEGGGGDGGGREGGEGDGARGGREEGEIEEGGREGEEGEVGGGGGQEEREGNLGGGAGRDLLGGWR